MRHVELVARFERLVGFDAVAQQCSGNKDSRHRFAKVVSQQHQFLVRVEHVVDALNHQVAVEHQQLVCDCVQVAPCDEAFLAIIANVRLLGNQLQWRDLAHDVVGAIFR